MIKIISVVGARPNFMKIAPFIRAIEEHNQQITNALSSDEFGYEKEYINHILVHTGQHYDNRMSDNFFIDLNIPAADINLGIGSGTHAEQVGQTMIAFEKVIKQERPDWVVVVGDVNATLACSITAKKEWVKCCHIEAGLRSGDIRMPEEINRLVSDRLCDLLLTPDRIATENLLKEGTHPKKIVFVGNIMIDTLEANLKKAEQIEIVDIIRRNRLSVYEDKLHFDTNTDFAVVTLHRPSNVDHIEVLSPLVKFLLNEVADKMNLFWPVHPRTKRNLKDFGLFDKIVKNPNVIMMEPLNYHDMLRLNLGARIMLTDSGGLQEECTVLGTPCLTLRWNTERPVTLLEHGGASILVGNNIDLIREELNRALVKPRIPFRPELWDGKTAQRCLKAIIDFERR